MAAVEKLSISVPPEMAELIRKRVAEGAYASASEVIRAALRLWRQREEERQEAIAAIRARLEKSAQSGPDIPLAEAFDKIESELERRIKAAR